MCSWPRPLGPSGRQRVSTALVLVYSLLAVSWLAPGFGRLALPAMVYAGAITVMTASTILAGFSRPFVMMGAILFMISDSLIAAARFTTGWPLAAYLIWPNYFLGQYGIAIGFLRETAGDDPEARQSRSRGRASGVWRHERPLPGRDRQVSPITARCSR